MKCWNSRTNCSSMLFQDSKMYQCSAKMVYTAQINNTFMATLQHYINLTHVTIECTEAFEEVVDFQQMHHSLETAAWKHIEYVYIYIADHDDEDINHQLDAFLYALAHKLIQTSTKRVHFGSEYYSQEAIRLYVNPIFGDPHIAEKLNSIELLGPVHSMTQIMQNLGLSMDRAFTANNNYKMEFIDMTCLKEFPSFELAMDGWRELCVFMQQHRTDLEKNGSNLQIRMAYIFKNPFNNLDLLNIVNILDTECISILH
eukprot:458340_1